MKAEATPVQPSAKCSGEELKAFLNDATIWPDGRFVDHYEISLDGSDWSFDYEPADGAVVVIGAPGCVCDDDPTFIPVPLFRYFEQWRATVQNR